MHTPGPWKLIKNDEQKTTYQDYVLYAVIGRPAIAEIYSDSKEDEANAALIAAAPEMLSLLLKVRNEGLTEEFMHATNELLDNLEGK